MPSRHSVYLKQMMELPEKRQEYVERLYRAQRIEEAIVDRDLAQDQALLEALRNARARILLDTLVTHEMAKSDLDVEELARERYTATREQHRIPKKIKLAVIYISKKAGAESQARTRIEKIFTELQEQPENGDLFHELARQYSDDKKAEQGGINKKWLVAPNDLEKRDPLMQAAFALERVGDITDIVESEKGFAVAKLMALTPSIPVGFDTARDGLEKQIRSELYYRTEADLLQSLQAPDDLQVDDELLAEEIAKTYRERESVRRAGE